MPVCAPGASPVMSPGRGADPPLGLTDPGHYRSRTLPAIVAIALTRGCPPPSPMRAVLQRVSSASVSVDGEVVGEIRRGLVVLLGVENADTPEDVEWLAGRITNLRLFAGDGGPWDRSVKDMEGSILLISQFTLHASTKKGTKPSWHRAAKPDHAVPLYEAMIAHLSAQLGRPVATGRFGAMMQVELVNDGPVTVMIDSKVRE
jgi:D-tyrosyl-tRNA(Tyr) deacylase